MEFKKKIIIIILVVTLSASIHIYLNKESELSPLFTYEIINKYPHDPKAFTQGLQIHQGILYEGTGLYGQSSLRIVDLESGEILNSIDLTPEYFGEGITVLDQKIYQLTWRESVGFIYSLDLEQVSNFTIYGEGWGLTTDGSSLILSNGTSCISFINPKNMETIRTIRVTYQGAPVVRINELEFINGYIYANIWQTDKIVVIDSESGDVKSWIDLTGIQNHLDYTDGIDVLNGISYDEEMDRLFVTGKFWPNILEIKLIPEQNKK